LRAAFGRSVHFLRIAAAATLGTAAVIAAFGGPPLAALLALVRGAIGSTNGWTESTLEAIPLVLTGLGVALAFQCHLWNIGAEGQLLVGELAAIAVGAQAASWPPVVLLPAVLIAGAAAGAGWAGIAALLRVFRGVPEVISTILLNFCALYLVSWATSGPLKEPGQEIPRTVLLPEAARLPTLGNSVLHAGLVLALLSAVIVAVILYRTVVGIRIRAVGLNPEAAAAAGMPVSRTMLLAFALSGALAGLAGAVQLTGVTYRLYGGSSPGTGYTAIAVALLGGLRPLRVLIAALFFGGLTAGSNEMQRTTGVSSVIGLVVQGLLLLLLIARDATLQTGKRPDRPSKLTSGPPERP
jgi:simple sugar transport system permease protein